MLSQAFPARAGLEDGLEGANTLYTGKGEDSLIMEMVEKKVKKLEEREKAPGKDLQVVVPGLHRSAGEQRGLADAVESLYRMIRSREEYGKQLKKKGLSLCQTLSPEYCKDQRSYVSAVR